MRQSSYTCTKVLNLFLLHKFIFSPFQFIISFFPPHRYGHDTWTFAYHQNLRQARRYEKKRRFRELDVVFLGDSILEGFKGTKFGRKAPHKKENVPVFESLFDVSKGAEYDGMVLAIAGDKVSGV